MRKIQNLYFMLMLSFIVGCASTVLEKKTYKSYTVGTQATSPIGIPFLIDQDGTVRKIKTWVGLINSPDGWKIEKRYSEDFVRKELIYSGKSGNTIEVSYREFRGGLAAPAFYQNLKYDLAESKLVTFQNFRIEVIGANNQSITYRIVRD